jgi:ribonuclease D
VTRWIRTTGELADLAASLRTRPALALDTESDSLHHHREKVCLVQLAAEGLACLVDPLSGLDMSPLGPLLADPAIVKVLHGADYDVTTLKRDFGFRFDSLFDTMLAARFLGLPEIGLQAVLRSEFAVDLSKESQLDDWSRRPLTAKQEAYAIADVAHLLPLSDRLVERLRDLGRLDWVREESAAVAALPPAPRSRDPEGWLRLKGVRRLSPREQAVAREVFAWREEVAERTDVPAFKILGTEPLLEVAQRRPRTAAELGAIRGLSPRARAQAAAVVAAVERALARPESELPRPLHVPRPRIEPPTQRRIDRLRAWRAKESVRIGLDVAIVLPQRLLEKVAEAGPRAVADLEAVEGLRRWRIANLGEGMVAALTEQP